MLVYAGKKSCIQFLTNREFTAFLWLLLMHFKHKRTNKCSLVTDSDPKPDFEYKNTWLMTMGLKYCIHLQYNVCCIFKIILKHFYVLLLFWMRFHIFHIFKQSWKRNAQSQNCVFVCQGFCSWRAQGEHIYRTEKKATAARRRWVLLNTLLNVFVYFKMPVSSHVDESTLCV